MIVRKQNYRGRSQKELHDKVTRSAVSLLQTSLSKEISKILDWAKSATGADVVVVVSKLVV